MSQPRVRLTAAIGLLIALAESLTLLAVYSAANFGGFLHPHYIALSMALLSLLVLGGVFAGFALAGGSSLRVLPRLAFAAVGAGAAFGLTFWPLDGVTRNNMEQTLLLCQTLDGQPADCPSSGWDGTPLVPVLGLLLLVVAVASYWVLARTRAELVGRRVFRLVSFLLALIPFANIVGFIGFLRLEARESTPPLAAVGRS